MSKMVLIGIRHDKLEEVSKLKLRDIDFDSSDYGQARREKNGLIVSQAHHGNDSDNLYINHEGVRYINSVSDPKKVFEDVKNKMCEINEINTGAEGIDLAGKYITKSEKTSTVENVKYGSNVTNISLYAFNTDDYKQLKKHSNIFEILVEDVKKQIEQEDLMYIGNYGISRGSPVNKDKDFPVKYISTLNEGSSALVNLTNGIYATFALPNLDINIDSKNIDLDLQKSLGIEAKKERKLKPTI